MVFRVGINNLSTTTAGRTTSHSTDWRPANGIRLYLIISRFEADHALTYLFCEGAARLEQVQCFVKQRGDTFHGDTVVVELSEEYFSFAQAEQRALALRTWLTNVNVVFPPIRII